VTPFAWIALLGWPALVVVLFTMMPHTRAAAFGVIGAWLLLPPYVIPISGLPDYTRSMASSAGVLLATVLFASDRLAAFRLRWFDLPMVGTCFCSIFSALSNGLTLYDGVSDSLVAITLWGLPYLVGRLYFGTPDGLRQFTIGMAIGGVGYVLPCLYEARMSPRLLSDVYGFAWWQGVRLGGYRPHVFFMTGLECGMWMTAASLTAWWLWYSKVLRRLGPYPFGPLLLALLVTNIFCRSTGAMVLFLLGVAVLWLTIRLRTKWIMAALLLVGPLYVGVRLPELWSGQQAVEIATSLAGWERADSLAYRFKCERRLGDHALERPIFGWGGYGRNLVYWDAARTRNVEPDGLWIGFLGSKGLFGLVLLYLAMALPAARFVRGFPVRSWGDPRVSAATLAAALLGLYIVDCLMNAFMNIIYTTLAGGLAGLDPRQLRGALASGRASAAAGRRAVGHAPRPASGRSLLADRCRTLGRSFRQEGRLDEADDAWRQALDLLSAVIRDDPADEGPRRRWCDCANDLAWLRANHPHPSRRDPASAVALARRAAEEYPDAAAYWNTLGAAHYRNGDPRAAIDALERARGLSGGTAFDDALLAMARYRAGDPEGARQALARAMLLAERDHAGHRELAALCDEAHSLIAAPTAVG
jgi:tetratricopeptide (TPR) repeat protein